MSKKSSGLKFALVKWVNGVDEGKYSIVFSSWLKGERGEDGETVVVEWRDQKKEPLGGWTCFDALLIKKSDSKKGLEKTINKLVIEKTWTESPESMKTNLRGLLDSDIDDSDADMDFVPPSDDSEGDVSPTNDSLKRKANDRINKNPSPAKKKIQLEERIRELEEENKTLRDMLVKEIPSLITSSKAVLNLVGTVNTRINSGHTEELPLDKKELMPNSKVFVDLSAWLSAKACNSPGGFISRLLVNMFTRETLLNSNFKGGVSKNGAQERKTPLDQHKLAALKCAVMSSFPLMKESQFGVFINQKLANLRSKDKQSKTQATQNNEKNNENEDF